MGGWVLVVVVAGGSVGVDWLVGCGRGGGRNCITKYVRIKRRPLVGKRDHHRCCNRPRNEKRLPHANAMDMSRWWKQKNAAALHICNI